MPLVLVRRARSRLRAAEQNSLNKQLNEQPVGPHSDMKTKTLLEYGVGLRDCGLNPPATLAQAAHCVDDAAFGRKTPRVLQACVARWHIVASAEALARSVSRKFLSQDAGRLPSRAVERGELGDCYFGHG